MATNSPSRPDTQNGRRSNSLVSYMKRSKSSDLLGERKTSSQLLQQKLAEDQANRVPSIPPVLPTVQPPPQLQSFGGENYAPMVESPVTQAPAAAAAGPPGQPFIHNREQSMTNRGRPNYAPSTASSINSPRRVRKRRDPIQYNVLVIGGRNSGKTSFINFLRSSIAPKLEQRNARNPELDSPPPSAKTNPHTFIQHYADLDMENERIGLSIWDSQGFEKNIIDFQLRALSSFIESKFEDTFIEEMKVIRAPGYRDTHIHCVFYLFDPAELDMNINAGQKAPHELFGSIRKTPRIVGALDEDYELQVLKYLQGKTTVIPIISKADTVTTVHMDYLKKMVGESFHRAGLDPLEALHFEQPDGEDGTLDEIDEEDELEEAKLPEQSKLDRTATGNTGESTEDTLASPDIDSEDGIVSGAPQANTNAPGNLPREDSRVSVSSVMFDNGYMPMSILSPDEHSMGSRNGPIGRQFVWGFADPYNPAHCDFVKLKETCFTEWRHDFKETSREVFYERWRTGRLNNGPIVSPSNGLSKPVAPKPVARKSSSGIPIDLTPRSKKYS